IANSRRGHPPSPSHGVLAAHVNITPTQRQTGSLMILTRRRLLAAGLRFPVLAALLGADAPAPTPADAAALTRLGPPEPFDFGKVKEIARSLTAAPYVDHPPRYGELLEAVDYDAVNKIRFRDEAALWPRGTGLYPVKLFHLHRYAKDPVRIFQVANGTAREVLFDKDLFTYGDSPVLQRLPADLGFAGFRMMNTDRPGDWLEFQSASYFRSAGELRQYGASARGVTVNTVGPSREEFPLFTPFWIEEPADGSVVVTALLDGFSLAGAFRFVVRREQAVLMDVEAALYPRKD